jgi:hypothetical protein
LRSTCAPINPIDSQNFMRCSDRVFFSADSLAHGRRFFAIIFLFCVAGLSLTAVAQTALVAPLAPSAPPVAATSSWPSLNKAQQTALAPLAKHWDHLSEGQKRKWLAIAITYPDLSQPDQDKLHSRMVEWAALSPRARELARLNFAQTKSVDKAGRAANWEAYQALSPEERKNLAESAKVKPVGAAVSAHPVAKDKLAAVPVTRHTPEPERTAAASQKPLNRNTLLPQSPPLLRPAKGIDSGLLPTPSKP